MNGQVGCEVIRRQTAFVRSIAQRIPQMASARFSFRADSNLTQLAAIRAGCGIGVCQVQLARRSAGLVRILADSFEMPLHTWIVMREDLRDAPRCRVAFDALVKGLSSHVSGTAPR